MRYLDSKRAQEDGTIRAEIIMGPITDGDTARSGLHYGQSRECSALIESEVASPTRDYSVSIPSTNVGILSNLRGVAMAAIFSANRSAAALLVITVLASPFAAAQAGSSTITVAEVTPTAANTPAQRQKMSQLGLHYKSAWDFFEALRKQAGGGQRITWKDMPDWGGIYTRTKGGTAFDPDGPDQGRVPTGKFTPEYKARLLKTVNDRKNGIEYDPLSQCHSPTYPRWFDLPFMREFIVTPNQTTMIAEAFNSIRRIYTDGRGHMPVADQFPTETGDAVGFWVGDTLVVHTNESMAHMYERAQGDYSDQVEGVEIWHKVDSKTVVANVWIYDPPGLAEPWYTRQGYTLLSNPDKVLRINNWSCKGNSNNDVYETKDGGSEHSEFTFMNKDAAKEKSK
jgi:hypothetical protein